jgi:hypothetical protein
MSPFVRVHLDQSELLPSLGVRRLLSVVCKLFTFQVSSPKPPGRLKPNLTGMFLGWFSTKLDITEIFLKVTLNTINLNQPSIVYKIFNIGKGPGG